MKMVKKKVVLYHCDSGKGAATQSGIELTPEEISNCCKFPVSNVCSFDAEISGYPSIIPGVPITVGNETEHGLAVLKIRDRLVVMVGSYYKRVMPNILESRIQDGSIVTITASKVPNEILSKSNKPIYIVYSTKHHDIQERPSNNCGTLIKEQEAVTVDPFTLRSKGIKKDASGVAFNLGDQFESSSSPVHKNNLVNWFTFTELYKKLGWTTYQLTSVISERELKSNSKLCKDTGRNSKVYRYSPECFNFLNGISSSDVNRDMENYKIKTCPNYKKNRATDTDEIYGFDKTLKYLQEHNSEWNWTGVTRARRILRLENNPEIKRAMRLKSNKKLRYVKHFSIELLECIDERFSGIVNELQDESKGKKCLNCGASMITRVGKNKPFRVCEKQCGYSENWARYPCDDPHCSGCYRQVERKARKDGGITIICDKCSNATSQRKDS